ncbi:hypothetical protein SAMN04488242_2390 [Tessaracoccus oleiagri]|uniref:DUF2332 domain-containing protein n=2 Tax=Tessaracoccus oleiagri TaxID=686624 RepID=A0A1G9LXQ1_9ACTN|nr:hypothetical protein SAMN04488242_2390 [Tessaracoccus oleiagri]
MAQSVLAGSGRDSVCGMREGHYFERTPIDELYRWFAAETAATSPTWQRLCLWIAETPEVSARLAALPGQARQPNRLLAAVRYLSGPTSPGPGFRDWLDEHWDAVRGIVTSRTTQTNEPGRLAVLAPVLASLPQPVALLELGTSAGLCLLPDRYAYRYDAGPVRRPGAATPTAPVLDAGTEGALPGDPAELEVAARRGVDAHPLDPRGEDTRRWLRSLVWPDEEDREERLAGALRIAAHDPPQVRRADVTDTPRALVGELVAELRRAAPGATPVVFHSAMMAYLDRGQRRAVIDAIVASGARWLSFEGARVVEGVDERSPGLGEPPAWGTFLVALDGEPVGWAQAHGRRVRWR